MHVELMRRTGGELPLLENAGDVTSMHVWLCKYKSFANLSGYANLQSLIIGGFPESDLNIIGGLRKLSFLKIMHLPKVRHLDHLAALHQLESLSLATLPSWDVAKRTTTIESLLPIASLKFLRHLELLGVCTENRSLREIYTCSSIRTARFSKYSAESVQQFYALTGAKDEFNPPPSC